MRGSATPSTSCARRTFREDGGLVRPDHALVLALCLISVAATYANTLTNGFVFDDRATVTENRHIRSLANVPKIFMSDFWSGSGRETQNYRPLQMASSAVVYAAYGLRPWGVHLTNLLFHLFAVAITLFVASRFTHSVLGPALAATLFGVHPMVSEAVNSIPWRGDLMAAGFVMASILGCIRL